jgi:hypothetical protein
MNGWMDGWIGGILNICFWFGIHDFVYDVHEWMDGWMNGWVSQHLFFHFGIHGFFCIIMMNG